MTVWHRLSTVFWEEVELFKLVTTCYGNVHRQKGPTIIAAFAASDRSYHHLKIRRLSQVSHRVRCHDIFFLFSKCLICLTHSHNASAVSLIFFCDSEYDLSYRDPTFCLVSTKNVPIFAHDEIETWLCIHVCCDNVVSVLPFSDWKHMETELSLLQDLNCGTIYL